MKKFLVKNWGFLAVLTLSLIASWSLFLPGYFPHHDDLHVIRIFEMRRCFDDFQIPCRWAPDMGLGYGLPLFNYYNPFVYYLGAILSYGLGYIASAKALFLIALTMGPVAVYFLGKKLWGEKAGVVSGVVFIFAPYRALDVFVRGALSEIFAISLVPLIFLFTLQLIEGGKKRDFFALTLLIGIFLLTHNISVIVWMPVIFLWVLLWLFQKGVVNFRSLLTAFIFGFGLAVFFIVPAFLEKELVTTNTLTQGDLNYQIHFAGVKQLFIDRFWGYGASKFGPGDELSLQIGWPHWWGVIAAVLGLGYLFLKKRAVKLKQYLLPGVLIIFFAASILMTHNKSVPVWETLGILKYLQFPWRYLAIAIFSASLLLGFVSTLVKAKYQFYFLALVTFLSIGLNWNYFRPREFYLDLTDEKKLTGQLWQEQQRGALFDYLPNDTKLKPGQKLEVQEQAIYISDIGAMPKAVGFNKRSNSWFVEIDSTKNSQMEVPVFNFPVWEVRVDGKVVEAHSSSTLGLIKFFVPKGNHQIEGTFKNTQIRSITNIVSLLSLVGLVVYFKTWRK